jgi:N-glycosidase YbiA
VAIYFYVPRDEWGWLSNFSPHGVDLDGAWWPTVEHYFQAAKFVETDPAHAAAIRGVANPRDAARMGRDRGHPLRSDWEAVKEDVMRRAVRSKIVKHPELREKLLATGEEEIVEVSPSDYYWGAGQDGSGQNRLGHILMEVRTELRAEPPAAAPAAKERPKKRP